jgi:hypothetical protein
MLESSVRGLPGFDMLESSERGLGVREFSVVDLDMMESSVPESEMIDTDILERTMTLVSKLS